MKRPTANTWWRARPDPGGAFDDLAIPRPGTPAQLVSALNLWATRRTAEHYVFHAAALVRHGVGVLLPGASRRGKSTLSAAWLRHGAELLSDEVGAIDLVSGRLVGYPRALSLRRDVLPLLGIEAGAGASLGENDALMVRAGAIGGVLSRDGAEARLVVLPDYRVDGRLRLRPLDPGAAAMALLEASCSQHRLKERGLDFVLDLARRLPTYHLTYSDLGAAVTALDELVEGLEHA